MSKVNSSKNEIARNADCKCAFAVFSAMLFCSLVFGQNANQTGGSNQLQFSNVALEKGKSVRREIKGGETHEFDVSLSANQFLNLIVRQYATDVVLTLVAANGNTAAEIDAPLGASAVERLWFVAADGGVYKLRIRSAEKPETKGAYEVLIVEKRPVDERAEHSVAAAKLTAEAFSLQEKRTAAGFAAAIEKYLEVVRLAQSAGDRSAELIPRVWLGTLYGFVGQPKLAVEQNEAALVIARESNDAAIEAQILDNFGRLYYATEPSKALEYLKQSLSLRERIGAGGETTITLNLMTAIYTGTGEYEKAVEAAERTLSIYRRAGNAAGEANTLVNLGASYALLGEHRRAIELYEKALGYFRTQKIGYFEVPLLSNIGASYGVLGDEQKAIEYLYQALPTAQAAGNRAAEAKILNNIANYYQKLGDARAALDYVEAALLISRELKIPAEIAANLNNAGIVYRILGEPQKSLTAFGEALPLARQVGDRNKEAAILNNIGAADFDRENYSSALANFNRALEIRRALGSAAAQADSLTSIGRTRHALGEHAAAIENYKQSLALLAGASDPREEAETLYLLAETQNQTGDFVSARGNVEAAIKIVESIRATVASRDLRASYLANVRDYYALRTDVLMNLAAAHPAENFAALALEAAENARARSLVELLTEARADIRQGVDADLLARERAARENLSAKANRQAQILAAKNSTPAQKDLIASGINRLTEEYSRIETEIRRANPRYAALVQPAPLSVGEIQRSVLDRDTILLEYSLGEKRSFLWAVGQNFVKSYELPARERIEAAARKVYESLTARNQTPNGETAAQKTARVNQAAKNFDAAARELSRMILAPAAREFGNKRLLVVADGALQYVPFGALSAGGKTDDALVVSNEIVVLPSASTIHVLRRDAKPAANKPAANSIAIVADPVFETNDARFAAATNKGDSASGAAQKPKPKPFDATQTALRSANESGLMNFPRLRFSRQEADSIAALAAPAAPLAIVDFAANKNAVLSGKIGKSAIVHFATHGIVNSRNPELSGVVLSLVNERGEAEDGFLRLFEIYNMSLDADLVVLSACRTALGKDVRGEGLIGLTRGFMYAGAPSVVASLWSVDDRATAELMQRFYQKMLRERLRPAAALREAQIEMRRTERWRDPYYWAAFTLQGEWR